MKAIYKASVWHRLRKGVVSSLKHTDDGVELRESKFSSGTVMAYTLFGLIAHQLSNYGAWPFLPFALSLTGSYLLALKKEPHRLFDIETSLSPDQIQKNLPKSIKPWIMAHGILMSTFIYWLASKHSLYPLAASALAAALAPSMKGLNCVASGLRSRFLRRS